MRDTVLLLQDLVSVNNYCLLWGRQLNMRQSALYCINIFTGFLLGLAVKRPFIDCIKGGFIAKRYNPVKINLLGERLCLKILEFLKLSLQADLWL